MRRSMSIKEFCHVTNMSAHTLRYYERAGLMPRVERTSSGHRRYGDRHELWVQFLRHLRMAGMSIAKLRRYAVLIDQGVTGDAQRMALLVEHRSDVIARLHELKGHLAVLNQKLKSGCGPDVERALSRRAIGSGKRERG
jgi:DNA-binding transcriptional MerR regulator